MKAALFLMMSTLATAAAAAPAWTTGEARVEWKHDAQPRVVVEDKVWRCEGAICTGQLVDKPLLKLRACRALARYAGRVTSFSTRSGGLDEAQIARCNGERG